MSAGRYRVRIGLEIHAQAATASKAFCGCATAFGAEPNTLVCPVCLGHPGALPVPNAALLRAALRAGLALGCAIRPVSRFARKNYFYPDLPKGYQITQYAEPVCEGGLLRFETPDGVARELPLVRIHIEEDAAKLLHDRGDRTLIDCNRAGVPLLEIVTEPGLRSPDEAAACFRELRRILRALGVCDGNMERGELRCDANISLAPADKADAAAPDASACERSEIKNLNSFSALQRALAAERERQAAALDAGARPGRVTLHWDDAYGRAVIMREKEEARDYRYFDEPDIPPLVVTGELLREASRELPELPLARRDRLLREGALARADANTLVDHPALADLYENACAQLRARDAAGASDEGRKRASARMRDAAAWILRDLRHAMKSGDPDAAPPVDGPALAALVEAVADGSATRASAAEALAAAIAGGCSLPDALAARRAAAVGDEALRRCAADVLAEHAEAVRNYRAGKSGALEFLVGAAMRRLGRGADPASVRAAISELLR